MTDFATLSISRSTRTSYAKLGDLSVSEEA